MAGKLQNLFHTETWWGKTIFIVLVYSIFWCISYGSILLIPEDTFTNSNSYMPFFLFIYVAVLLPILSLFFTSRIRKSIFIKHYYLFNTIFIILSLLLFFYIDLLKSMPNWFNF